MLLNNMQYYYNGFSRGDGRRIIVHTIVQVSVNGKKVQSGEINICKTDNFMCK